MTTKGKRVQLCPCGYSTSDPEKMRKHKEKIHHIVG